MSDTIQNITNNYTAAIQSIKQAILKSRYRVAAFLSIVSGRIATY
jgi:hypothetical protein